MLGILFALTFTLAAGSQHSYSGIEFAGRKTFIYHYEAQVLTGLPEKGFGRAGLRIKSKVEIRSANPKHFLLKTYDLKLEEFNGIWPRDSFTSSAKLSKLLEKQLSRPIKFEYSRGQVGDIYIPYGMSDIVVNIIKGILNILQITIKKTQNAYSLQESGIGGICYTSYTIEENKKTNQLLVIKSKDLNNCEDRVHLLAGDAFSYKCHNCNQRNKNSRAAATYNYKIKETRSGAVLTEADVIEVHQFTPFSEVGGTAILEARQRLVLVSVQELSYYPLENDYKTRGSLRYHFTSELFQTPVHLLKMKNAEAQAIEILHQLVEPSIGSSSKESPTKFLQLIQCLREASSENIEAIWKQFSLRPHYRRWILDAIPAIAKPLSLRFLKHKISIKDLTEFEAVQGVLMTLHLIKADHDAIAEAKSLLEVIKPQRDCLLRKVAFLSYGSLVLKKCIDHCSEDVLQPIKDLLAEAASESHERDMVLALKTLGNTEHPASIKSIQKFLPGFSSSASKLPVIIQSSALIALKSIAQKDPKKVQDICLQLIANLNTNRLIRIIAIGGLIESKPPAGIVMALANILQKETDIQVATYSYSLLKILSQSSAPDLQEVAAASDIAIALLKTKYERLGVSYSTGISYDVFRDSLMSGISVLFKTIKNPANGLPLAFLSKLKVHFMGVFTNLLEVGFQAEGIQELLMNRHIFSPESKPSNMNKIMDIIRKLSQWKPLPQDEPIASTSIMIFGQEIYYHHLDKSDLQNIVKFFYRPKEKFSTFGTIVTELQTGINMKWSKALLSSETRHIVPTCVGLPLETSLYYSSVTRAEVNAQAQIDALPAEEITFPKLIDSNININSKISISMDKDITFVMGINTHLIQAALEVQAQIHVSLPTNVAAKINIKQRNFKLEMEPPHKESEIISLRSKAYAVTRIAEDIDATKMIPVVPAGTEPNVLKQTFNPRDLSAGEFERTEKKYSGEVLHKEIPSSEEQQAVRPSVYSSCAAATNFGLQLCVQHKSSSAAFIRNSPFYHMIGSHSFKVIFKPVHMDASVEKIQIEFQAGPQAAGKMVRTVKFPKGGKEGQEMENTMGTMVLSKLKKILGDRAISQGHVNNNSKSSSSSVSIMETIKGARCKTEKKEKAKHHELKKKHLHPHQKQKHLKCKCKEEEIKKHQHKHKPKCSKHKHGAKTGTHGHHHHSKKSNAPDARKNDQSNNENQHGRCKFLSSSSSSDSSSVSHRKQKDRKNVQQKDRKNVQQKDRKNVQQKDRKNAQQKDSKNVQQKDRKNVQQKDSKNVQQKDSKSKCSSNSENSSSKSSTSRESSSVSQRREKGNKNAQNQESNSKYTRCTESSSSESSNCIENSSSESSNSKESSSSKCRKEDSKNTESSNSEICESSESSSVSQSSISFWDELSSQSTDAGENPLSKNSSSDCGEWTNDANQRNASISCDCNKWPFTCRNSSAKPKKVEPLQKPQNPHQANTSIEYWETNGTVLYEIPVKSASALMQRFIGEAPEYTILVRAIMSDNTNRGYQSTTYLDSYKHHMQTIMVSLNENNPWKACLDAAISGSRKTWAMVRWGRHCQDYKMSAKLSSGQIAENSAVQMALQWGRLPTWMKDAARRVMKFMPGVAYMLGFSEIYRKNPSRKLIVRVAGTSTQQIDTIIKAPTLTIYKQAIPVPFYYAHGSYLQNWINENRWSILPEITSILTQAERVECEVRKERFTTFDKAHLDCSISSANTYTVLAQDCTNQLRFIITMKKMGRNNPTFQIDAKLGSFDIELYSDASKEFHVILDGRMLLLQNNTYVNEDACIRIHRNATMLTVKAPKHGVEQIAFNGEKAKVTIAPWLKGKTCGICGNADGQRHNDLLKPNQEKAKNCNSLVHSWMLPDNLCTGSMLNRQFVMLQNHLVDEEESACYSLEPVLKCLKGCNPTSTIPVKVAFHCLPKESAIDLEDWRIRPKELSVDLIQEVDAHSDCVCTTECAKA